LLNLADVVAAIPQTCRKVEETGVLIPLFALVLAGFLPPNILNLPVNLPKLRVHIPQCTFDV
jgi:hypothetical protein